MCLCMRILLRHNSFGHGPYFMHKAKHTERHVIEKMLRDDIETCR